MHYKGASELYMRISIRYNSCHYTCEGEISMWGLQSDKAWCYRHRTRRKNQLRLFRAEAVEAPIQAPRLSREEIAARIDKMLAAYKVHEYRMQTDPIYRKLKKKEERKFNLYMFFHDFWTFKRCLTAPVRFLWRKLGIKKE